MTLQFDDLDLPLCERCMAHFRQDKPRMANPRSYFMRYHTTNGHR